MATTVNQRPSSLGSIIARAQDVILAGWQRDMLGSTRRSDLMKESELQAQCNQFLRLLAQASTTGTNVNSAAYEPLREMLSEISRTRATQGFSAREG